MNAHIAGIGVAVPGAPRRQSDLADIMTSVHGLEGDEARALQALYQRTQIDSRYSVLDRPWVETPPSTAGRMSTYVSEAPSLAHRAAEALFAEPGMPRPHEIDQLYVVSCTGFRAPGVDAVLVESLGLRRDVGRSIVGFQGCHGGLSALRLARDHCRAAPGARALVVCVELCSLHVQHEASRDNLHGNALFADGAAACLVVGDDVHAQLTTPSLTIHQSYSLLHPDGSDLLTWDVGDQGFMLGISARLPAVVRREVSGMVSGALGRTAEDLRSFPFWAVHPGGVSILDAVIRALGLPETSLDTARDVLRRYGNMSSATIYFVLREQLRQPFATGDRGVVLAFGPGLTVEVAEVEVTVP